MSASDAIVWSRAEGDVVLIRPGDSNVYYAAGRERPHDDVPLWPEGQELTRRLEPELLYLDRPATSPPIAWRVRHSVALPVTDFVSWLDVYNTSLRHDDEVEALVEAMSVSGSGHAHSTFTVDDPWP
jgi:hypothetical protein